MTYKLGFIGYSAQDFDKVAAKIIIDECLKDVVYAFGDVEVVSGYTNLGIPALAYEAAAKRGLTTVGIACMKAFKYDRFPCDKFTIDPLWENWGDESATFINYCDSFVRVGGGPQSMKEVELIKAAGKSIKEYNL